MPENEFEKKVQQQMEELRLRPSNAVWSNVEKELKEKKKRRVIFFVFLLAGLCLLGYSGYLLTNHQPSALAVNKTEPVVATTGITIAPAVDDRLKTQPIQQPGNETKSAQTATGDVTTPVIAANQQPIGVEKEYSKAGKTGVLKHIPARNNDRNAFDITIEAPATMQRNAVKENASVQSTAITPAEIVKSNDLANAVAVPETETVTAAATPSSIKEDSAIATETKPVTLPKKKHLQIKWGADLSGGLAFTRADILSFSPSQASFLDMLSSGTASPPSNGIVRPPSLANPGPAFKMGIAATLKLTRRSSLLSGLRYSYLSEKIKVGSHRERIALFTPNTQGYVLMSVVAYRGATQQPFTNKYHFIELPLTYQLQINKGNKLPVLWNIGTSFSHLLSTNALVYDTAAGGVYYKNKNAFQKLHVGLQMGLSFRFGNEKKVQWTIGPELSLDLSKQFKQERLNDKKYLLYGGLTGKLFFGGKKK